MSSWVFRPVRSLCVYQMRRRSNVFLWLGVLQPHNLHPVGVQRQSVQLLFGYSKSLRCAWLHCDDNTPRHNCIQTSPVGQCAMCTLEGRRRHTHADRRPVLAACACPPIAQRSHDRALSRQSNAPSRCRSVEQQSGIRASADAES